MSGSDNNPNPTPPPSVEEWRAKVDFGVLEEYLSRGFSSGLGDPKSLVCVEAALCLALGIKEPSDNPPCTAPAVRAYKIRLNDAPWPTPAARAEGMRALAYAQIGTVGVLDEKRWVARLTELTIGVLLATLLDDLGRADLAKLCREQPTAESARKVRDAADAAHAAAAAYAVYAAADAVYAEYLPLSASLALQALQEQGFGLDQKAPEWK